MLPANTMIRLPSARSRPDIGKSSPMPMMSSSGLPIAIVSAKPRNGMPRIAPIISAECALSIGSRKMRWMSAALLARSDAAMPAVVNASALTRNSRAVSYPAARSTTAPGAATAADLAISPPSVLGPPRVGGRFRQDDAAQEIHRRLEPFVDRRQRVLVFDAEHVVVAGEPQRADDALPFELVVSPADAAEQPRAMGHLPIALNVE